MGAWNFVDPYLEWVLGQAGGKTKRPRYARQARGGFPGDWAHVGKHLTQLKAFMDDVFAA